MQINLTAETVYHENGDIAGKRLDGGIRLSALPANGMKRIPAKMLKPGGALANNHTRTNTHIIAHTNDGDVSFKILREPGRYCLTCGDRLPSFAGNGTAEEAKAAKECLAHVKEHGNKAETSKAWPHGYENYPTSFLCEIEETELTKRLTVAGE